MSSLKSRIDELKEAGKQNPEIVDNLKKEGYSSKEIYDVLSNEELDDLAPPTPSEEFGATEQEEVSASFEKDEPEQRNDFISSQKFSSPSRIPAREKIEDFEEIAESIISEKMDELSVSINDISLWKEKTSTEIEAIKQEILRIRNQFENLQVSMLGKVEDYKRSITDVNIEVKTLSKVLEKILQPLTENVKELSRITERLKR
ncbi:hypothetical protein HYT56_00820 [Candidatus Woesearchaeota archaeon]|nr:hypothetical protein [Candidatus Woesearchaeota archaeon]